MSVACNDCNEQNPREIPWLSEDKKLNDTDVANNTWTRKQQQITKIWITTVIIRM